MRRISLFFIALFSLGLILTAQENNPTTKNSLWSFSARLGLQVGASTPVPTPKALDHIYVWYPGMNPSVQLSASRQLHSGSPWAVNVGLAIEKKGMEATTRVKGMDVAIISDSPYAEDPDEEYPGLFTGDNNTKVQLGYLTLPVQAEYSILSDCPKLRGGLYASLLLESTFRIIIDGTMVYDDPTLGSAQMDLRELDFSNRVRGGDFGLLLGADYYFSNHIGVFADIKYGLLSMCSDFKAIPYSMHNIYAGIGFTYRLFH